MLETRNIYIDTQVFVANNFFANQNLRRIQEFGQLETVKIFTTEITKSEIEKNIKEDLSNAISEINRFRHIIANKGKVLKNVDQFKPYFDLPKIELNLNFKELSEKLDNFIKISKTEIISYEIADIKDVVEKYLNEISPFSPGRKKYEFPDAIVISTIENWCKSNKTQMYFVSSDSDFANINIPEIIVVPNIKILLDKINKQHSHDENEWIFKIFDLNESQIINLINKSFEDHLLDESMYDIEISNIQVLETNLFGASLVEKKESLGEYFFQFDFDITFTADIEQDDYSQASYDKEDDVYYFVEKVKVNHKISITQSAEISIEAYFEEKDEIPTINCTYVGIPTEDKILQIIESNYNDY